MNASQNIVTIEEKKKGPAVNGIVWRKTERARLAKKRKGPCRSVNGIVWRKTKKEPLQIGEGDRSATTISIYVG